MMNENEKLQEELDRLGREIIRETSIADEVMERLEDVPMRTVRSRNVWRVIMKRKLIRIAAIFLMAIGIAGLFYVLTPVTSNNSGLAFADVVDCFQVRSYSFDVIREVDGISEGQPVQLLILSPGKLRSNGESKYVGKYSAIFDFRQNTGMTLIHNTKVAIRYPLTGINASDGLEFFKRPILNLWDLKKGNEKRIGKKVIDGILCEGFYIKEKDPDVSCEMTIWVDSESGKPVRINIPDKNNFLPASVKLYDSYTILYNYKTSLKLDEKLFRLNVPEGYVLSKYDSVNEWNRKRIHSKESQMQRGEKLIHILEKWAGGEKQEAIRLFLKQDWCFGGPTQFPANAWFFSMSEGDYISLKQDEQDEIMKNVLQTNRQVQELVRAISELGDNLILQQKHVDANKHFESIHILGRLLNNDERLNITQMTGRAIMREVLPKRIKLFEQLGVTGKMKLMKGSLENLQWDQEDRCDLKTNAEGKGSR